MAREKKVLAIYVDDICPAACKGNLNPMDKIIVFSEGKDVQEMDVFGDRAVICDCKLEDTEKVKKSIQKLASGKNDKIYLIGPVMGRYYEDLLPLANYCGGIGKNATFGVSRVKVYKKDTQQSMFDANESADFMVDEIAESAAVQTETVYVKAKTTADAETDTKVGANGYVVINRDSAGGTDHDGGKAPAEAVEMVSDEKGNFTIYGLDSGTYYLKETDSPAGYRELQDPIVLSVKATMTDDRNNYVKGEGATDKTLQKLEATAHMKEFLNGAYKEDDTVLNTDVSKGSMDITVVNTVGTKLPITGSFAMLIMLGAGVVLVSGGVVMNKKKKNPAE